MATSGSFELPYYSAMPPYTDDKALVMFYWEVASQSVANNNSTISWRITAENVSGSALYDYTYQGYLVKIDNVEIAKTTISKKTTAGGGAIELGSGEYVVSHTSTGTKTITFYAQVEALWGANSRYTYKKSGESATLPAIAREAKILTAANFTDEDNPVITYSNPAGSGVTALEACISLTGGTDDIAYRGISKTGSSYTFEFTDDERNTLRIMVADKQSTEVRFYIRTTVGGKRYFHYVTRTLTITSCNPIIHNPTVRDVNSDTLALTGDENTVVRYESMAEYGFEPEGTKAATIVSQAVQCGDKIVTGLSNGIIDDVESNLFVFTATDSRGLSTTAIVEKTLVDYVKPTCYQKVVAELAGETGAKITVKVSGNYFNGSFGAVNNTIKIEIRHTQDNGDMGNWTVVNGTPTFDGNTYQIDVEFTGLSYTQAYTFQSRMTDKLNFVQSSQYTARVLPVYDWSEEDFNVNVPFKMNGETVLRHNAEAGNTVLSGSDGHIYLRPGGTEATGGETIFKPDGSVSFSGPILVNGVELGGAADYIVETGTEAMGTNGTWYWEKWNSGKAVCWGCRNYGKMATSTAIGNVYRSAMLTQDFPLGLFTNIPDVVHAHVNSRGTLWGGWVLLMSPTASSTGDFAVAHTSNVNLTASYVNFHVIGRWK